MQRGFYMENQKQLRNTDEIIADLYALRAGLSVISQKSNEIKMLEKEEEKATEEFIDALSEVEKIDHAIAYDEGVYNRNLEKWEKEYQEQLNGNNKTMQYLKEEKREIELKRECFWNSNILSVGGYFYILFIEYVVGCVALMLLMGIFGLSYNVATFLGIVLAVLAIFGPFIVQGIRKKKAEEQAELKYKRDMCAWERKKERLERDFEQKSKDLRNEKNALEQQYEDEIEKELEERKRLGLQCIALIKRKIELIERKKITIPQNASYMKLVKQALNRTYDSWFFESDWGNIDLIIFYIETGRADTFKEALQLLDRQLQTNQMVSEIRRAGQRICGTIHDSTQRLGSALTRSFSVLGAQLQGIHNQLHSINGQVANIGEKMDRSNQRFDEISKTMKTLNGNISQSMNAIDSGIQMQLSATELNNALLEQANRTSDQLLGDLRYGQKFWVK